MIMKKLPEELLELLPTQYESNARQELESIKRALQEFDVTDEVMKWLASRMPFGSISSDPGEFRRALHELLNSDEYFEKFGESKIPPPNTEGLETLYDAIEANVKAHSFLECDIKMWSSFQVAFEMMSYPQFELVKSIFVEKQNKLQLIEFFKSYPMKLSNWLFRYDKGDYSSNETKWRKACEDGDLRFDSPFLPTSAFPIGYLALLAKIDRNSFYDVLKHLPIPQLVEQILSVSFDSSDELLETVKNSPVCSGISLHPVLMVGIKMLFSQVPSIRSSLESGKMGSSDSDKHKQIEQAVNCLNEWRGKWYSEVLEALSTRADSENLLSAFGLYAFDEVLRVDSRYTASKEEKRDRSELLEKIAAKVNFKSQSPDSDEIPENADIWVYKWIVKTLKEYNGEDGKWTSISADLLLEQLEGLLPSTPVAFQINTQLQKLFNNYPTGILAGLLRDSSNPHKKWYDLWKSISPLLAVVRRNQEKIHDVIHTATFIQLAGYLAVYGIREAKTKSNEHELLEEFWESVVNSSIYMIACTPFPDATNAIAGFRGGIILAAVSITQASSSLNSFIQYSRTDPELLAMIMQEALNQNIELKILMGIFHQHDIDIIENIKQVYSVSRENKRVKWGGLLKRLEESTTK